ncbi:MAG TPA: phosphotransferase family protein [Candidatus Limnocylindrales bacterium]|nr:phosphotransferase family protein [Candidatus Limnocylindrales bacterium]
MRGIDEDKVTAYLAGRCEGMVPPLTFEQIVGGHSNLTYKVTDSAGASWVLRRPPLGAVLATAHDMGREHRIISALANTGVPVPPAVALCQDESVNGAPFYVMKFVEGHVLDTPYAVHHGVPDRAARTRLGAHVIESLAALHMLDPGSVGLGDLGRKEAYLDRQLSRWRGQWEKSKTRELPAMEETYELLVKARPEQKYTGIVHGDYRLGNMLCTAEGRVAAVLDWELCTLGDTMADLGYIMNNWAEENEAGPSQAVSMPTAAGGFPTRAEFLADYSARTGRSVEGIEYYRAFQWWRLAAIVEGVLARYLKGVMGEAGADMSAFRQQVDQMADEALMMIRGMA